MYKIVMSSEYAKPYELDDSEYVVRGEVFKLGDVYVCLWSKFDINRSELRQIANSFVSYISSSNFKF